MKENYAYNTNEYRETGNRLSTILPLPLQPTDRLITPIQLPGVRKEFYTIKFSSGPQADIKYD